jgi:hypothetical protein
MLKTPSSVNGFGNGKNGDGTPAVRADASEEAQYGFKAQFVNGSLTHLGPASQLPARRISRTGETKSHGFENESYQVDRRSGAGAAGGPDHNGHHSAADRNGDDSAPAHNGHEFAPPRKGWGSFATEHRQMGFARLFQAGGKARSSR